MVARNHNPAKYDRYAEAAKRGISSAKLDELIERAKSAPPLDEQMEAHIDDVLDEVVPLVTTGQGEYAQHIMPDDVRPCEDDPAVGPQRPVPSDDADAGDSAAMLRNVARWAVLVLGIFVCWAVLAIVAGGAK